MKAFFLGYIFLLAWSITVFGQDFYDTNTINTIEITFSETNWDQILDTYYANDNDEKLMGSVVINGEPFDSIGVKFKGNSTYSANNRKNPLHIELDYLIKQDYDGYESIKLSNGKNDPSFVREVLSYQIARKYMNAPLSNYAKVYINGSFYGMFSSSEAINGDFVDRRLDADKDNTRLKCNPEDTFSGNGSSLEYLGTSESSYYNYYELKSDSGWQDLIDLTYGLVNEPAEIETILDIDRAIWMLAFDNVLVNLDSYIGPFRQNYYLVKDDNDLFLPILWDLNESFGAFEAIDMNTGGGGPGGGPGGGRGIPNDATGATNEADLAASTLSELDPYLREGDNTYPLLKMIFDNDRYKKMYIAHCKTMLEENFENGWYETEANALQSLIANDVLDDPNAFYTSTQFYGNIDNTQDNTLGITELMEDRITYLNNQAAFNYTQPTITAITSPDEIAPYSTITITAEIADANYVELGYRHSKDEVFTKIQMYDDGNHNDGAANDQIYGISFLVDESNTHYYIYAENSDAASFSPKRAQFEYYKITAVAEIEEVNDLVINEIMASNTTTASDENGEFDDWIELYNNTDTDISLFGYYLTDDETDVLQWAFPDTTIAANDYLIIWADKDEEQSGLHAEFKLSSSGETVYLVNSSFVIVNSVSFEEQTEDQAYARYPNGTGEFTIQDPTFSENNNEDNLTIESKGNTLNEGETATITTSTLKASDTEVADVSIIFTITESPNNGIIQNSDSAGISIISFTQQDLIDEKIQYIHDDSNTLSDEFTFTVSDGIIELTSQIFSLSINPIDDDAPILVSNKGLLLNEGETANILPTKLLASDTEADDASLIFIINQAPEYGILIHSDNPGVAISSFKQQELLDSKIKYINNGTSSKFDSFIFSVSDGLNELTNQTFDITIYEIVENAPFITENNPLTLLEGETIEIAESTLSVSDVESSDSSLTYIISELCINGQIEHTENEGISIVSFTQQDINDGKIQYVHNGSNTTFDGFTFSVSDGQNELLNQNFSIVITAVDDDAPSISTNNTLILDEGATAVIKSSILMASDTETEDASLLYTVAGSCINGHLENSNNAGVSIEWFTNQDIVDERIKYVHNGSNTTTDTFTFSLSDGNNEVSNQTFNIVVNPIDDDSPVLITNEELILEQGETAIITSHELLASDTEVANSSLIFIVTTSPENGFLEHSSNPGTSIMHFSLQAILDNKINYVHNGTATSSDMFTFKLSDGLNEVEEQTFTIAITLKTDVEDFSVEEFVQVYPNPASDFVYINSSSKIMNLSIYSLNGSKVTNYSNISGSESLQINISSLQRGTYIMKMITKQTVYTQKILVQ